MEEEHSAKIQKKLPIRTTTHLLTSSLFLHLRPDVYYIHSQQSWTFCNIANCKAICKWLLNSPNYSLFHIILYPCWTQEKWKGREKSKMHANLGIILVVAFIAHLTSSTSTTPPSSISTTHIGGKSHEKEIDNLIDVSGGSTSTAGYDMLNHFIYVSHMSTYTYLFSPSLLPPCLP